MCVKLIIFMPYSVILHAPDKCSLFRVRISITGDATPMLNQHRVLIDDIQSLLAFGVVVVAV